jgi:cephalosporin hydroxylase
MKKMHSDFLKKISSDFMEESVISNYSYNFDWLSRPIIQYPQDIVATQEIIWRVKPDLIIETGIAHGGSLILSASILALLDYCEAAESGELLDTSKPKRMVVGVDIDIRDHNRKALDEHPLRNRLVLIEGSSIDSQIINKVEKEAEGFKKIMVFLDSNHTHSHVLDELRAYAPLVSKESYCVVFDSVIEDLPDTSHGNRPWKKGNNPKTALKEYLIENHNFTIDKSIDEKLMISVAPNGYLKRK